MSKYLVITILFFFFLLTSNRVYSQAVKISEQQIRQVLSNQVLAWNNGNIYEYMQGYWNSDSLLFIGKKGLSNGWNSTLSNYQKSYSDKSAMGNLSFELLNMQALENAHYLVIGKWNLKRATDNLSGHFSLLFRKIDGKWFIVADHSS